MTRKILWLFLAACAFGQTSGNRINVVPFTASPTFDLSLAQVQKITLTGNVTSSFFANGQAGQTFTVIVCQDATGGRTFTWPTSTQGAATVTASANGCTSQPFSYDGLTYQAAAGGGGASSFPVTSAQNVNTAGSITSSGIGQIAGTQERWSVGPPLPVITTTTQAGGSLIATHQGAWRITFNSAAGQTLAGPELLPGTNYTTLGGTCASGSACTVTIGAPTLPSGYTSATFYGVDCNAACTSGTETAIAGCVAITTACTETAIPAGAALPTTNTAYSVPSPVGTNTCTPGTVPTVYTFDGSNWYPYMGVDGVNTGANPPSPYNKITICRPFWFVDSGTDPPLGRNSFVLINHLQNGTVTNIANQDRGLQINGFNCIPTGNCTDATTHYGLEALQVEQDLNGAPTINGSPDGEVSAGSYQMADFHTGTMTSPNQFGVNGIRVSYFREGGAGTFSSSSFPMHGVLAQAQNNSTVSGGSAIMSAFEARCSEQSGAPVQTYCADFHAAFTGTYTGQWGIESDDSGSCSVCYDAELEAANENQGKNAFQGTSFFSHISAGNLSPRINFTNPTCTFASGGGTTPSCAIRAGSSDSLGRIVLTTGTGAPAGTITATLTFHVTWGSPNTDVSCVFTPQNNAGTWNGLAVPVITAHSTSAVTVQITNGTTPTALATSTTYDINYVCSGN